MEDQGKNFDSTNKYNAMNVVQLLNGLLKELQACNEMIIKHSSAFHRAVSQLDEFDSVQYLSERIEAINECAKLLIVTSSAMTDTCSKYLELIETQKTNWEQVMQRESEQQIQLEEIIEQLARQQLIFEQAVREHKITQLSTDEIDENIDFYDAESEELLENLEFSTHSELKISYLYGHSSSHLNKSIATMDNNSGTFSSSHDVTDHEKAQIVGQNDPMASGPPTKVYTTKCRLEAGGSDRIISNRTSQPTDNNLARKVGRPGQRRCRVPDKPNHSVNLWRIMKSSIGKEITKIPIPVNFSEPLSMLQRLTEDYEYVQLLDHAATLTDPCEQLAYVTAFTITSYSTTAYRTGKPFNPFLGETYECDRTADLGWRCISEQVCHHPPTVAQYCEGKRWKCWQEFTMSSKFRGKYLQINPLGIAHLEFLESGNHYTWKKVTTMVHNIIVGKLWIDQCGDTDIVNHKDGSKCHLSYIPYSYFSRGSQRKVNGCIMDKTGQARWLVTGTWDKEIAITLIKGQKGTKNNPTYETGPYSVIWTQASPPKDCVKYYNFTTFACQLNQMEEGVAPTDSRHRPDQRLMEEGKWDEANEMKLKLEEKQRAACHQQELSRTPYEPIWFKKERDTITGTLVHVYKHRYWECKTKQDWSMCPDIFSI